MPESNPSKVQVLKGLCTKCGVILGVEISAQVSKSFQLYKPCKFCKRSLIHRVCVREAGGSFQRADRAVRQGTALAGAVRLQSGGVCIGAGVNMGVSEATNQPRRSLAS